MAFLDASKAGSLMALTTAGLLWHWDLVQRSCVSSCGTPSVSTLLGNSCTGELCWHAFLQALMPLTCLLHLSRYSISNAAACVHLIGSARGHRVKLQSSL